MMATARPMSVFRPSAGVWPSATPARAGSTPSCGGRRRRPGRRLRRRRTRRRGGLPSRDRMLASASRLRCARSSMGAGRRLPVAGDSIATARRRRGLRPTGALVSATQAPAAGASSSGARRAIYQYQETMTVTGTSTWRFSAPRPASGTCGTRAATARNFSAGG